jgi:hypothetical protein
MFPSASCCHEKQNKLLVEHVINLNVTDPAINTADKILSLSNKTKDFQGFEVLVLTFEQAVGFKILGQRP